MCRTSKALANPTSLNTTVRLIWRLIHEPRPVHDHVTFVRTLRVYLYRTYAHMHVLALRTCMVRVNAHAQYMLVWEGGFVHEITPP